MASENFTVLYAKEEQKDEFSPAIPAFSLEMKWTPTLNYDAFQVVHGSVTDDDDDGGQYSVVARETPPPSNVPGRDPFVENCAISAILRKSQDAHRRAALHRFGATRPPGG